MCYNNSIRVENEFQPRTERQNIMTALSTDSNTQAAITNILSICADIMDTDEAGLQAMGYWITEMEESDRDFLDAGENYEEWFTVTCNNRLHILKATDVEKVLSVALEEHEEFNEDEEDDDDRATRVEWILECEILSL